MPITTRLTSLARTVRPSLTRPLAGSPVTRKITTTTPAAAASHPPSDHGGDHGGDHGHDSHYDPPGGWLWGIRPGDKYEKEGWEDIFIYGFGGCFLVAGIAYVFKEDTS